MYYQFLPHSFGGAATDGGDFVLSPSSQADTLQLSAIFHFHAQPESQGLS